MTLRNPSLTHYATDNYATEIFRFAFGCRRKAVLDLNKKVKAIEASEKDKFLVKEIMAMFNAGKTLV
jgi:hypothetical protein